jgi:hypothetical protein
MIALMAVSCKQEPGTVTGVVSFFFNKYQGYKPDIGAKVYVTLENCDSIDDYLRASDAKAGIELDKYYLEEFKSYGEKENKQTIDDLNKSITDKQEIVNGYAKDTTTFKQNEVKAYRKLSKITTNKDTYKTTVDGVGNFTIDVPPGKYNVLIISVGRTKVNLLEVGGQLIIKSTEVKSKEKTNIDVKFEV